MDFDYTPEQEQLRKDYRTRLEAVMTPERRASVATPTEGGAAMTDCRRALGEAGCSASPGPTEYGGGGSDRAGAVHLRGRGAPGQRAAAFVTLNTVGPTLIQFGTDEQKQKFLPAILKGDVDFAIGYSEPGAGSDLASLRTTRYATATSSSSTVRRCSPAAPSSPTTSGWPRAPIRTPRSTRESPCSSCRPTRRGLLLEAAAHHAGRVHVLHLLRRRPRSRERDRARRERRLDAGDQPAQPGTRRPRQSRRPRATLPQDAEVGVRPPRSTTAWSSTSPGCSRPWPGSKRKWPPTGC